MSAPDAPQTHTNRLVHESSPYLLQHAHNPVDWYAWGEEAFAAARSQNKPIFLSVGYSTCYWCHVMERQSFEVESIAAIMNEKFINIKVDREERPDVDQLYMTAIQVMTRSGGWPMSVFLTPDLRPFWGGTYFPPADAHGRPGFPTVLNAISDHFKQKPDQVEKAANQLVDIISQIAEPVGAESRIEVDEKLIEQLVRRSTSDYEPMYGGFGGAPKFPRETLLELLLNYAAGEPASAGGTKSKPNLTEMTLHALDAMANGGIRDHLGGAFHRYSTDAQWLVPHFEIMLYDNAMLGWCYTEAYRQSGEARYAQVARGVFDFVLREMTSPSGAFYTAFDAEVDAQEGLSYLWTAAEIEQILGSKDAKIFNHVYGVDRGPNFADPHHGSGTADKNILFLPDGPAQESDFRIIEMRRKLYEARRKRKQPLLDTKILTSWNALMIRAMAFAAKVLTEPKYFEAASRAAEFLLANHRKPDDGLFRTSRLDAETPSPGKLDGFLDDYAFLAHALLQLERSSGESRWRKAADETAQQMRKRFIDESRGGFYFTDRSASDLIIRQKTASDSPLPSGNAVAARIMLELGFDTIARDTIALFAPQLEAHGEGMGAMVLAAFEYVKANGPITIEPAAAAPARPTDPSEQAASIVQITTRWQTPTLLWVRASIAPGYHIHTNCPVGEFIATQLFVTSAEPPAIEYPDGKELRLAFADEPLDVYSGRIEIAVKFAEQIASPMKLSLQYQACDGNACLPPVTKRFEVSPP